MNSRRRRPATGEGEATEAHASSPHTASITQPSAVTLGRRLPSKAGLAEAHAHVTSKELYFVNDMPPWSPQDPPRGAVTKA